MINEEKRLGHKDAEPGKHAASPESDAERVMLAVLQSVAQPGNQPAHGAGEGTGSPKAK